MTGPGWLAGALAAVVLTVAVFAVARLVLGWARPRGEADADIVHVLMGVAMAGMFVPRLATLPNPAWEIAFAAGAAWFAWRAVRHRAGAGPAARPGPVGPRRWCACPVPHLIDCLAMVYVLWAVPAAAPAGPAGGKVSGMAGMTTAAGQARLPALALALAVGVCAYVVWLLDRLPSLRPVPQAGLRLAVAAGPSGPASRPVPPAGPGFAVTAGSPGPSPRQVPQAGLRLAVTAGSPDPVAWPLPAALAPRAAACCKVAMGVAMGVMLISVL